MATFNPYFKDLDLVFIGKCFRQARKNLRLPVVGVAKLSGVSRSHILKIENGEFDFSVSKLVAISNTLCIPISALLEQALTTDLDGKDLANFKISESAEQELDLDNLFDRLYADPSCIKNKERIVDLVVALVEESGRLAMALLLSSNPSLYLLNCRIPFDLLQKRFTDWVGRLDLLASHVQRRAKMEGIVSAPYSTLKEWAIFDYPFFVQFLNSYKGRGVQIDHPKWISKIIPCP